MSENARTAWENRHNEQTIGAPEPFVAEMLPLLPLGLVLDVAAGTGRHSLMLARSGFTVHAIDYSLTAMLKLAAAARAENLPIYPLAADLSRLSAAGGAL